MTPEQLKYFDAGWHERLATFDEQWQSRPCSLTLKELIRRTDRLLKLLQADKDKYDKKRIVNAYR
jgi:hypothetical protein